MLLSSFRFPGTEAGCDEAGRGCLAGPVFAAAVILPPGFDNKQLNDSKQLSASRREALREVVEREALAWSVASIGNKKIDEINILNASILAMHRAIDGLKIRPSFLIIDGNRFKKYPNIEHVCLVKGDSRYLAIAAASVLAKTHRDEYMVRLHDEFPDYHWASNKGYPTAEHRKAILQFGLTAYHRKSFHMKEQLKLTF
jgi:ribonuclease HII